MNKVTICAIPLLLTGLTMPSLGFAAMLDNDKATKKCEALAQRVLNIAETEKSYRCEEDVKASGIALQEASLRLKSDNFEQAFRYLKIAERSLTAVFEQRQLCSYFSPRVKPALDEVVNLQSEIPID